MPRRHRRLRRRHRYSQRVAPPFGPDLARKGACPGESAHLRQIWREVGWLRAGAVEADELAGNAARGSQRGATAEPGLREHNAAIPGLGQGIQ